MNVKLPGSIPSLSPAAGNPQSSARSAQASGFRRDAAQTLRFDDDLSRARAAAGRRQRVADHEALERSAKTEAKPAPKRAAKPARPHETCAEADASTTAQQVANKPETHAENTDALNAVAESEVTTVALDAGAEAQASVEQANQAAGATQSQSSDGLEIQALQEVGEGEAFTLSLADSLGEITSPQQVESTSQVAGAAADEAALAAATATTSTDAAPISPAIEAIQPSPQAAVESLRAQGIEQAHAKDGEATDEDAAADDAAKPASGASSSGAGKSSAVELAAAVTPASSAAEPGSSSTADTHKPVTGVMTSTDASAAAALPAPQGSTTEGKTTASFAQILPQPNSSLRDDENVGRIARGLQSALNQRGGAVTLRLNPPELGALRIDMVVRDGVVTARFTAEHESVRNLLMDQMSHLRQGLDRQGLVVDRLEVKSPDNASEWMQQRHGDGADHDGRSAGHEDASQRQQAQSRRFREATEQTFSDAWADLPPPTPGAGIA